MIETLSIAMVFVITEIFKYLIAKIEVKTGKTLTKEGRGYIIICFAFLISFIYSALVVTNIIDQSVINITLQIFAGAIATYEVLYKLVLVKLVKLVTSKK